MDFFKLSQKIQKIPRRTRVQMTFAAAIAIAVIATSIGTFREATSMSAVPGDVLYPAAVPKTLTDADSNSIELGLRFRSRVDGMILGIRFYKGPGNTGNHSGSLWTAAGTRLSTVTFRNETAKGWQTATFTKPITIQKNRTYVASYFAPKGKYSVTERAFARPYTRGDLTIPAGGGVYSYGTGGFPRNTHHDSNYFVDVVYRATGSSTGPSTIPSSPTPSASPSPSKPAVPVATAPATSRSAPPVTTALSLPRIPWEGGSSYWKQFPATDTAGWNDPSFFPIVVWYNGISSNSEAIYDKSVGINTYIGMSDTTPYSLFKDNGVYWIGGKLNSSFTNQSSNWVGNFLDDEVDGRFTPTAGRAWLQQLKDENAGSGRFNYANFTQIVMSTDGNQSDAEKYVNNYTDAVSADMYWYTIPFCSQTPYRGDSYLVSINQANCRTSSSYGKTVDMLRQRDAVDGKLQPIWNFIENFNGGPGPSAPAVTISPAQLKGAVMNSIINEARGIVYFNQSLSGSCQGGSILRQSQVTANFCGSAQIAAAKDVNGLVRQLAPVINTQSYHYSFGAGLDTMLKTYDGSAYIFSMLDGSSSPGNRTFTLPTGIRGFQVEVVGENRTIPVSGGKFSDGFGAESAYHVYKISL